MERKRHIQRVQVLNPGKRAWAMSKECDKVILEDFAENFISTSAEETIEEMQNNHLFALS
jgi:hypothetical protein